MAKMADGAEYTSLRRRGRPDSAAAGDVREQILNTAERLFAVQGFAATAIREISRHVNVNPAMVHYYFGTKTQLLQAVVDRALEPLAVRMAVLQQSDKSGLPDLVDLLFSISTHHPHLLQLITREVFLPGGHMQQRFLEHFAPRLGGRLPGMLLKQQEAGRVATDVDPKIAALMILSLCFFPLIARPVAEKALGVRYDDLGLKSISEHVSHLLKRGLSK